MVRQDRFISARALTAPMRNLYGLTAGWKTINSRLFSRSYRACRPRRKPLLTANRHHLLLGVAQSWSHESTSSVTNMPFELKWRSLEQRRADAAFTMLYKIRNGHFLTSPMHVTPMMGILASAHPHHYVQYQTETLEQWHSFCQRIVQLWNAFPNTVALTVPPDAFGPWVSQVLRQTWN